MPNIFWIKITTDMFDDEKIKVIESMPEADSLLVIWVKLICLAGKINDKGNIYLTPKLTFSAETLATILSRPLNVVRLALDTFQNLSMIEINNSGNIYLLNWSKHQNIEGLARIREQGRERIGRFREKQKLLQACNVTVTFGNGTEKSRVEKNIEEENGEKSTFEKLMEEKRYEEIIIGAQSLGRIIRCLKGEEDALPANKKLYRDQLRALKIDLASLGINEGVL